jgi:hypothetical protein
VRGAHAFLLTVALAASLFVAVINGSCVRVGGQNQAGVHVAR